MKRARKEEEPSQQALPGAFYADGSFNPDGFEGERGPTDRLVRAMVAERRTGKLSPGRAADFISASSAAPAFPNRAQWSVATGWATCQCSTSAEEVVKREGKGAVGQETNDARHWCGERWMRGSERDCHDERHKVRLRPEQVHELVSQTMKAIGRVPSVTVYEEEDP